MSLSVNRLSNPQANYNNSKKIGFGEAGIPSMMPPTLEERVAKLEEKAELQGKLNPLLLQESRDARTNSCSPCNSDEIREILRKLDKLA